MVWTSKHLSYRKWFSKRKSTHYSILKKLFWWIILVQIYVENIIFGATNELICKEFQSLMHNEFEMSMIEELKFFVWLPIKQADSLVYLHQTKYVKELLKRFKIEEAKAMSAPLRPITSNKRENWM